MDKAVALARLRLLVAPDERPALSADDLDTILAAHRIPDATGLPVTDPAWVPSWDLDAAAAEAWSVKAARVAGDFTFSADDASYNKGEVMAKCLQMAEHYGQRGLAVLGVAADYTHTVYDSPRLRVN